MSERIGLTAVLELSSFSRAVSQYNSAISGMSRNTASTASSISSSFVGLGSGILKVGAIAAGVGLAGIAALTGGLLLLGSTALAEFARYERAALSIQSLVARELSQGQQVEVQRQVLAGLTKKEAQELEGLAGKIEKEELARNTLHARIKEQSEALRQLRDAHGEDALNVQTATARLAELENKYNESGTAIDKMKGRITELSGKEGQLVTVMDKVRTGQISMTEAMEQAGPRAAELLKWISKLAIQSPFTQQGIQDAFQTALAYGFTTEAAQRLTEAEVDYAAATGKSVEVTNLVALALGQMQAKGKVSGQEIIQLTNAGIGVNAILEDMGFTLDDVSNGLVDADTFIEAVIKDMEIFEGAGAAQSETFSGLISTLGDLKAIGLREFFTGTFTAIQPYLADFVGMLTSAALETGSIRELGDALGTYVAGGIAKIVTFAGQMRELFGSFQTGGAVGLVAALGITPDAISLIEKFRGMISQIAETIAGPLMTAFGDLSAGGILESINQSITFLNDHFAELQGALLGIGAILAGGVLAALVAGILSLLTPINLIIAGAALLGAAWAGNWGGIQEKTGAVVAYVTEQVNALREALTPAFNSIWDSLNRLSAAFGGVGLNSQSLGASLQAIGAFIIETAIPTFVQLAGILANTLAMQIQAITDGMIAGHNAWLAFTGFIQTSVVPALLSVNSGITTVTSVLIPLGELINTVINKALQAMAGLWQNVLWPALVQVGNFLKDSIMPTFTNLGKTVNEDISPSLRDFGEVVLPLLVEGMEFINEAIQRTISYFEGLKSAVENLVVPPWLQTHSPPPLAQAFTMIAGATDEATRAIARFGSGIGSAGRFIDDLDIGGFLNQFGAGQGGIRRNFRNIIKNAIGADFETLMTSGMSAVEIMAKIQQTAARFNFPPSFATEFAAANGLIEHLTSSVSEFQQAMRLENLGNMLQMGSQLSGIAGNFASLLQPALDERGSIIQRLQEFIEGGGDELFRFDYAPHLVGVDHVMMSRIRAQEQLNLLLREQEEQEALITRQKEAQQKLTFLQAQLDLIKLGRELGGNIFQGITFGLNASVEDLLAATNAVTEAMINQINSDLQIGSPSRLMINTFKQVMAGAAVGMERGKSLLSDAVRSIPILNGSIPQPVFSQPGGAGSSSSTTYNYNFPMTVSTAATAPAVVRQYEIKRSMYAN